MKQKNWPPKNTTIPEGELEKFAKSTKELENFKEKNPDVFDENGRVRKIDSRITDNPEDLSVEEKEFKENFENLYSTEKNDKSSEKGNQGNQGEELTAAEEKITKDLGLEHLIEKDTESKKNNSYNLDDIDIEKWKEKIENPDSPEGEGLSAEEAEKLANQEAQKENQEKISLVKKEYHEINDKIKEIESTGFLGKLKNIFGDKKVEFNGQEYSKEELEEKLLDLKKKRFELVSERLKVGTERKDLKRKFEIAGAFEKNQNKYETEKKRKNAILEHLSKNSKFYSRTARGLSIAWAATGGAGLATWFLRFGAGMVVGKGAALAVDSHFDKKKEKIKGETDALKGSWKLEQKADNFDIKEILKLKSDEVKKLSDTEKKQFWTKLVISGALGAGAAYEAGMVTTELDFVQDLDKMAHDGVSNLGKNLSEFMGRNGISFAGESPEIEKITSQDLYSKELKLRPTELNRLEPQHLSDEESQQRPGGLDQSIQDNTQAVKAEKVVQDNNLKTDDRVYTAEEYLKLKETLAGAQSGQIQANPQLDFSHRVEKLLSSLKDSSDIRVGNTFENTMEDWIEKHFPGLDEAQQENIVENLKKAIAHDPNSPNRFILSGRYSDMKVIDISDVVEKLEDKITIGGKTYDNLIDRATGLTMEQKTSLLERYDIVGEGESPELNPIGEIKIENNLEETIHPNTVANNVDDYGNDVPPITKIPNNSIGTEIIHPQVPDNTGAEPQKPQIEIAHSIDELKEKLNLSNSQNDGQGVSSETSGILKESGVKPEIKIAHSVDELRKMIGGGLDNNQSVKYNDSEIKPRKGGFKIITPGLEDVNVSKPGWLGRLMGQSWESNLTKALDKIDIKK